jgi:DNA segregation ATPase FtsK/SpoIIIE, S-DNA-T family
MKEERAMPRDLQVRQVREALYWGAGGPGGCGEGRPSHALLGSLFHETFAALVGPDQQWHVQAALGEAEPELSEWKHLLREHAYTRLIGPKLFQHQAVLREYADRLVDFWRAVECLTDWLAEILFAIWNTQKSDTVVTPEFFQDVTTFVWTERPLSWEVRLPGWTDSVRLSGAADAVWWVPRRGWCVLELKIGQTAPEADLGQACLYHQMLRAIGEGDRAFSASAAGPLALVSFEPQRRERLLQPPQLQAAQETLLPLIGRLAGVLPDKAPPNPLPSPVAAPENAGIAELGKQLLRVLEEYGAKVEMHGEPIVGPAFIRFPLKPARGVKWKKVADSADELPHRMGFETAPFISQENGCVMIDVRRPDRATVLFREIERQLPQSDPQFGCSRIILGVGLDGALHTADLSEPENAHVLVAGTTGSGKSEWLRVVLAGLLSANTPETLRLVLIDPKRNAFHELRGSEFLLTPESLVYPDEQSVTAVLAALAEEMDARYRKIEGYDNLAHYLRETGDALPRIVCVCDEYFDLVNRDRQERKEIERLISRLGAKARAAGIHLIVATQRPDRETVKGALDANLPARLALKVQKRIESMMVLQEPGAENLLGHGDLLFRNVGKPVRLQAPYLPPEERSRIFHAPATSLG